MKTKTTIDKTKTTINKICYKGIEILLPTSITVDTDKIKNLYAIDRYALILHLFGESLNLEKDESYENYIKNFIHNLDEEIQKLHKENEEIIEKLDKVLNL